MNVVDTVAVLIFMALVVLTAMFAIKVSRWLAIQAAYARMHEIRFHAAAKRLCLAHDTDEIVLKMLRLMNRTIMVKRVLWRVIVDTALDRVQNHRRDAKDFVRSVFNYLDHMDASSHLDCAVAVTSFVLALTYRQLFLGTFVRRFMLFGIHKPRIKFDKAPSEVDFIELYSSLRTDPEWKNKVNVRLPNSVTTFVREVAMYEAKRRVV